MTAPTLPGAMKALALRDEIANALNECECGHFVNEHGGDGCLAAADEATGIWSDAESDWLCICGRDPRVIQQQNVAVMVADAAREAEAKGYDAGCVAEAAAWKPERDALAKELADAGHDLSCHTQANIARSERDSAVHEADQWGRVMTPTERHTEALATRRAPVNSAPHGTVSWEEHVKAWETYARHHSGQSAERIAERGGFGLVELTQQLGHVPSTWLPDERTNRRYFPALDAITEAGS